MTPRSGMLSKHWTGLNLAWAAGLFEGEGCITQAKRKDNKFEYRHLTLEMSDKDIVDKFQNILGCGSIRHRIRTDKPNSKPTWQWNLTNSVQISAILYAIYPWLGIRRRQKALEAIRFLKTKPYKRDHVAEKLAIRLDITYDEACRKLA